MPDRYIEPVKTSELSVITKAKDLCGYIMIVTDKSPKKFRFTLVSRMQNYAMDIIENLYYAKGTKSYEEILRSLSSYSGHLKHGHTYRLKKKVLSRFVLVKQNHTFVGEYPNG